MAELAALLTAGLEHDAVLRGRLDDELGLPQGQGQRLLAVHVLLRGARGEDLVGVPVVRRRDHDGVDVLSPDQLLVVRGRPARRVAMVLVHPPLGVGEARGVDLAEGGHAEPGVVQERAREEPTSADPDTDHADAHGVLGEARERAGEGRGRERGAGRQELAAVEVRRLDRRRAVATDVLVALVVREDEDEVGARLCGEGGRQKGNEEEGEWERRLHGGDTVMRKCGCGRLPSVTE